MEKVLEEIKILMDSIGLSYHYLVNTATRPTYPYYIGELQSVAADREDGVVEYSLIITGFGDSAVDLVRDMDIIRETIGEQYINNHIAMYFDSVNMIDSGLIEIKKAVSIIKILEIRKG